ncbi:VOC family protein [Pseudalkalibacillus decolorationis]|uniref:VOC family protein n=1 Tax=Pseudalkalibacillus decolorationis TaxID=163879 RepID=UPI002148D41F|nr:VOC family protein [Pseudalkalibacillus decolorationis]
MITKLEHVGVVVSDMEKSLAFYQNIIGLQLRLREALNDKVELAFLSFPEQDSVEVELICGKKMNEQEGRVNHLAFTVDHLEVELERLVSLGVNLVDESPRSILNDKVKIAFFEGPDGEKLELVER